jgi:hypothetical protein
MSCRGPESYLAVLMSDEIYFDGFHLSYNKVDKQMFILLTLSV